ncbi:Uncharacterised protein [Vibrio cholerae]|nr:Uncharacterised protein [Vibrio cholerae]
MLDHDIAIAQTFRTCGTNEVTVQGFNHRTTSNTRKCRDVEQ